MKNLNIRNLSELIRLISLYVLSKKKKNEVKKLSKKELRAKAKAEKREAEKKAEEEKKRRIEEAKKKADDEGIRNTVEYVLNHPECQKDYECCLHRPEAVPLYFHQQFDHHKCEHFFLLLRDL